MFYSTPAPRLWTPGRRWRSFSAPKRKPAQRFHNSLFPLHNAAIASPKAMPLRAAASAPCTFPPKKSPHTPARLKGSRLASGDTIDLLPLHCTRCINMKSETVSAKWQSHQWLLEPVRCVGDATARSRLRVIPRHHARVGHFAAGRCHLVGVANGITPGADGDAAMCSSRRAGTAKESRRK